MAKKIVSSFILVLTAAALFILVNIFQPYGERTRTVRVPEKAATRRIARLLYEKGVIRSPAVFTMLVRSLGDDRHLKAGLYEFAPRTSAYRVFRKLGRGEIAVLRVTFPEGWRASEIASLLEERDLCPAEDFLAVVREKELEGFLFPETYLIPSDFSAPGIAQLMVRGFENAWQPEWDEQLQRLGLSRREVVILASIIEREAQVAAEKPVVSSVFHNRLRRGMPLQADPTVLYALGTWNIRLTRSMLQTPSPYNTYLHRGLPPGPICNPGRNALRAALFPSRTDYIFFVSNRDGTHTFSRTLREHNQAIIHIRENRRIMSEQDEGDGEGEES